jgi:hypothetical protein
VGPREFARIRADRDRPGAGEREGGAREDVAEPQVEQGDYVTTAQSAAAIRAAWDADGA